MPRTNVVRRCLSFLLLVILGMITATTGGCRSQVAVPDSDDSKGTGGSSITQTILWEFPESPSTTQPDVPAFDPPFGTVNRRMSNGEQIRVFVDNSSNDQPERFAVYAIAGSGQVLWELDIPFVTKYAPSVRWDANVLLAADGWLFILADWYEEPDHLLQIIGISPEGEIAWAAEPPDGVMESSHFQEYNNIFLDSTDRLLATDYEKRLYLLDRDGQVSEYIDDAFDVFNSTRVLSSIRTDEGVYLIEGNFFQSISGDYGKDSPHDYFISGSIDTNSEHILLINPYFHIRASYDTRSIISRVVSRPEGGLIIGGDAGEVAAFDINGDELWRYMPDQTRTLRYAWRYSAVQHPPLDWDMPTGVADIEITDQGTICITTQCGNLFALSATGGHRWSWPNAGGAPVIRSGYGVNDADFHSWIHPGVTIKEDGSVVCGTVGATLTLDPETGELLKLDARTGADYIIETADGLPKLCSAFMITAVDHGGAVLWQCPLPDRILSRPAACPDGSLVIPTARGLLYSVSTYGAIQWETGVGGQVQCQPAVAADGRIFTVDVNGKLTGLSPDGNILWSLDGMSTELLPPVAGPAGLAVVTGSNGIAWISFDGAVVWEYPNERELLAPPAVSTTGLVAWGDRLGRVFLVSSNGELVYEHTDEHVGEHGSPFRITQAPVFMPDGSLIVEFADWPFYGDNYPYDLYSTVKCLAPDGSITWELVDSENRLRYEYSNWGDPAKLLLSGNLINGEYVLLGFDGGIWLYDATGLVCELATAEAVTNWTGAKDSFPSAQCGIYTNTGSSTYISTRAEWSEISLHLP